MTKADRIKALIDHLWPTDRWHVLVANQGDDWIGLTVMSQDKMTTYARVDISGKSLGFSGYRVGVSWPAFNGTLEKADDHMAVIATMKPFLEKLEEAAVIKEGP